MVSPEIAATLGLAPDPDYVRRALWVAGGCFTVVGLQVTAVIAVLASVSGIEVPAGALAPLVWSVASFVASAASLAGIIACAAFALPLSAKLRAVSGGGSRPLREIHRTVTRGRGATLPAESRLLSVQYANVLASSLSLNVILFAFVTLSAVGSCATILAGSAVLGSSPGVAEMRRAFDMVRTADAVVIGLLIAVVAALAVWTRIATRRARAYVEQNAPELAGALA